MLWRGRQRGGIQADLGFLIPKSEMVVLIGQSIVRPMDPIDGFKSLTNNSTLTIAFAHHGFSTERSAKSQSITKSF